MGLGLRCIEDWCNSDYYKKIEEFVRGKIWGVAGMDRDQIIKCRYEKKRWISKRLERVSCPAISAY